MLLRTMFPLLLICAALKVSALELVEDHGFKVPAGFGIELYADDALAHDICALAIDPQGRVVVSGPGYIKTLIPDEDATPQSPVAVRAVLFSDKLKSGAQGLCFVGSELFASGDNAVWRFRDADGDGVADGPPEKFVDHLRAGGEHGAHGIVQGPDGWLYVIGGDGSGLTSALNTIPTATIKSSIGGAILRVSLDGRQREVIAHGFRNPYAMCFNSLGSIFAWDSDGERVEHLPGYRPCSLFDVGRGRHHGWMNQVPGNPYSRPWHWLEVVNPVVQVGRGSPTGIVCYRHRQFPEEWQGGLFFACWTFGRVYFCKPERTLEEVRPSRRNNFESLPPAPTGSTYTAEEQLFLEPSGNQGFAPTALAVGPDGALYVSSGGRGTRGAVYRVAHRSNEIHGDPSDEVEQVLDADQPDAAWSRRTWMAQAKALGMKPFEDWLTRDNVGLSPLADIRALEVLTELFGGVRPEIARHISSAMVSDPARMKSGRELLARLPWTAERNTRINSDRERNADYLGPAVEAGHQGHRAAFESLMMQRGSLLREGEADGADGDAFPPFVDEIRRGSNAGDPDTVPLLNMRTLMVAGGDYLLHREPAWQDGYRLWFPLKVRNEVLQHSEWWTTARAGAAYEYARLVAMTQVEPAGFWETLPQKWTEESKVSEDLHYLFVAASRVNPHANAQPIADAWLRLHHKLRQRGESPSRMWPQMVDDAFSAMLLQTPALADAVVASSLLNLPEHAMFLEKLDGETRRRGILALTAAVTEWTPELVGLAAELLNVGGDGSGPDVARKLSTLWEDPALRDAVTLAMLERDGANQGLWARKGLTSFDPGVAARCVAALARIPGAERDPEEIAALMKLLLRFEGRSDAGQAVAAAKPLLVAALATGAEQRERLLQAGTEALRAAVLEKHPDLADAFAVAAVADLATERVRWAGIDLSKGDAIRGKVVFEQRQCARCHAGNARLGPDLKGVAQRWSAEDLFLQIADPNRTISPTWKGERFVLKDGREFTGSTVYDSPAGMLVQITPDETIRVTGAELHSRTPSEVSLMPPGLLQGLSDSDLADLHAWLATLK